MIPTEVFRRVFQFKHGTSTGTCFAIDVNDKQYLCTAKHCLPSFEDDTIEIYHDNQWKLLEVDLVGYGSHSSDVCVLAPNNRIVEASLTLDATSKGLGYGQEVFFLGFPYRMRMDSRDLNRQFPMPFVKQATVSAIDLKEDAENTFYLDGHNNPGFSGGPVVFTPVASSQRDWRVAAIVSGYRFDEVPVLDNNGKETGNVVHANTGIVRAYGIKHALEAIHSSPIGYLEAAAAQTLHSCMGTES